MITRCREANKTIKAKYIRKLNYDHHLISGFLLPQKFFRNTGILKHYEIREGLFSLGEIA